MCGGSSGYEAIVDAGIIVVAHFKNPLGEDALKLLKRIFSFELRALIPLSLFLGASLIVTKYLRLPFKDVNDKLKETLRVSSPAFYEDLRKDDVIRALEKLGLLQGGKLGCLPALAGREIQHKHNAVNR